MICPAIGPDRVKEGLSAGVPALSWRGELEHMSQDVVVIGDDPVRAEVIRKGLEETEYAAPRVLPASAQVQAGLRAQPPDVLIIDMAQPRKADMQALLDMSREIGRPVAVFVDESDEDLTRAAMEAGVGAYVVLGLNEERVRHVVDTAVSRFRAFHRLQTERDDALQALSDRRLIEEAKALLIKNRDLTQEEAAALLRRAAVRENRKITDIARDYIASFTLDS